MTIQEAKDLVANETLKLETLTKIVELLAKLEEQVDDDAVAWVIEKIQE